MGKKHNKNQAIQKLNKYKRKQNLLILLPLDKWTIRVQNPTDSTPEP